ncbi:MAG: MATE family efflux transporter [bacterium]|nr:MATE family efflux transporter [bacterium]
MSELHALTSGKISRQLAVLAAPVLLSSLCQQLYNTADALMIGHFVGHLAFAAAGIAGTAMNLFIFILAGCCTGISVILAALFGNDDMEGFRREFFLAACAGTALSVIMWASAAFFLPQLLDLIRTPLELTGFVSSYILIILSGLPASFFYNLLSAVLRSVGDTKTALYFLLLSITINTILDYIMMVPMELGIAGAAWATVISQIFAALVTLVFIRKKYPELVPSRRDWVWDKAMMKQTLSFASISAMHSSSLYFGKLLVQGCVNTLGTPGIAAYTAATRIEGFANSFAIGGGAAMSVFIAQNMGASKYKRAQKGLRVGMAELTCTGLILAALMFIFARPLIDLFITTDTHAAKMGTAYLRIIACFYILPFICNSFSGWFRGTGRLKVPFICTTTQISVRLILTWLFIAAFGLNAVAWATGTGWTIMVIVQLLYYKLGRKADASDLIGKAK